MGTKDLTGERSFSPDTDRQLYATGDEIREDERLRSVDGSLEALIGRESIQLVCTEWLHMPKRLLAMDYAERVRKIYTSSFVSRNDAEIIDKFIGDINNEFLPELEGQVKTLREDLDQFMKDELKSEELAMGARA